ncbi:uncharacterized protein LOC120353671 [Nilaparvata lugens]|uniref:uncharacterized protein LOC120353671 n=1 Tax=Nilaparvata lugens TaxID=108931 RepID=UPI00193D84FB|nr:uncharacterized protein LOC120353671 [Nilaparvata lugens]
MVAGGISGDAALSSTVIRALISVYLYCIYICGVHQISHKNCELLKWPTFAASESTELFELLGELFFRNLRTCADNSQFLICCIQLIIIAPSCVEAFFILTATELRKAVLSVMMFFFSNLVLFINYHNGQRIFNQNDRLRKSLMEVPWTDKPRWLRQAMHIMLTQANRDMQIKPYGIYALNYMSFKDLMKFTFSVGNVLYKRKQLTS